MSIPCPLAACRPADLAALTRSVPQVCTRSYKMLRRKRYFLRPGRQALSGNTHRGGVDNQTWRLRATGELVEFSDA
jgi:hypothetical protein